VSDGMRLDRSGMDSPYFITDIERMVSNRHPHSFEKKLFCDKSSDASGRIIFF
jgi:hypothetical protein